MEPSEPVYGVRKRVPAFKRHLHVQMRREEKTKRSTRRQLKDAPLFRKKASKKGFVKKPTGFSVKDHKPSHTAPYTQGQKVFGKGSTVTTVAGNSTAHKSDAKTESKSGAGNGGSKKKYHIMKRSSFSTDEKVTGELQNIFGDDQDGENQQDKKTLKKRENALATLKDSRKMTRP